MARFLKSLVWFCGLSGLGYGLMILTTPSQQAIDKISKEYPGFEKDRKIVKTKNQQFADVLESAARSEKPVYLMTKEELKSLAK